ncbi:hypothetical protein HPB48_002258 [Haemaphysalis longicornis]|uniref:Uncharacterized protein n=1 Tax=Haemaphysalis longicornis TaxID=44386 RepID=A0A9J6FIL6_HAELO|nr:hypothetical protein HPB48_002258 [Haemaphysalis longicornis]
MVCVLRVSSVTEDESASELLQAFWQLESMGIADSSEQSTDCLVQFKQTIQKNNGRYTVALPWKEGWKNSSTDNRDIALNRLQRLVKRLSHQEGLLQRGCFFIQTREIQSPFYASRDLAVLQKLLRITAQVFKVHGTLSTYAKVVSPASITAERWTGPRFSGYGIPKMKFSTERSGNFDVAIVSTNNLSCINLHPFFDNNRVLRLSGRLQGNEAAYEEKHPVVLPKRHAFTKVNG